MSNMVLQCNESKDFKPHPEGIHPAVCVDVIDLGLVETEFQGQKRMVNKVKVVFESEQKSEDGKNCTVSKNFTASLHPKAKLADFLGKWRGRPVVPGETIDLAKLIGACCTLVISHQQNIVGRTYASIDAVSKPTKKLAASGQYDPAAARQRIAEWSASARPHGENGRTSNIQQRTTNAEVKSAPEAGAVPKSQARQAAPVASTPDYDPEVGF